MLTVLGLAVLIFVSCSPSNSFTQVSPTAAKQVEVVVSPTPNANPVLPSGMRTVITIDGSQTKLSGEPFYIQMNNCEGTKTVTTFKGSPDVHSIDIEVTQNVITELGGTADVVTAILQKEIAAHLETKFSTDRSTWFMAKTIPPGSQIDTEVQGKGEWITGTITIVRQDDSYIDRLPFSVLNHAMLMELGMTISNCNDGIVSPEPSDNIRITTTPIFVETMVLPGNTNEGTKFTATQPGFYVFNYVSGSYSVLPVDEIPPGMDTWRTTFYVFLNRPAEWQTNTLTYYPEYVFGRIHYTSSDAEAEKAAQGQTLTVNLKKGDYLLFVPHDQKPEYSDNPGEVLINVLFVPQ